MESDKNLDEVSFRVYIELINDLTAIIDSFVLKLRSVIEPLEKSSTVLIIPHDFLWRINDNLKAIICIKQCFSSEMGKPTLSTSLLFRSIVADLMLALFWLSLEDNILEEEVEVNNLIYGKYYKDALDYHYELALDLFPDQTYNKQKLYDRDFDRIKKYLTTSKGKPWVFKSTKDFRSDANHFTGNITYEKIYNYFKNSKIPKIKEKQHLYKYYRNLSQGEHYSIVGRDYSYKFQRGVYIEMITLVVCSIKTIIEMTKVEEKGSYIDKIDNIFSKIPKINNQFRQLSDYLQK
ncbi:MAG: hypothetical protein RBR40_12955 [Tenuifilaceae bacterium]|jgi:hypothetical protein|nr:hypothetical protein [Tenuifilaceae bacterium]